MIKKKRDERRIKNAELKQKKNEVITEATPPLTTPFFFLRIMILVILTGSL